MKRSENFFKSSSENKEDQTELHRTKTKPIPVSVFQRIDMETHKKIDSVFGTSGFCPGSM